MILESNFKHEPLPNNRDRNFDRHFFLNNLVTYQNIKAEQDISLEICLKYVMYNVLNARYVLPVSQPVYREEQP